MIRVLKKNSNITLGRYVHEEYDPDMIDYIQLNHPEAYLAHQNANHPSPPKQTMLVPHPKW